jgi:hypothetical protein
MIYAFMPEYVPKQQMSRDQRFRPRFPNLSPLSDKTFHENRQVDWRDLDPANHVNNANYYHYLEECSLHADQAAGWPTDRTYQTGAMPKTAMPYGIFTSAYYGDNTFIPANGSTETS